MTIKQENQDKIKSLEAKVEQLTQELQVKDEQLKENQELLEQLEQSIFNGEMTAIVLHEMGNYLYELDMLSEASLIRCQDLERMFSEAKLWLGEETIEEFFTDNPDKDEILPILKKCLLKMVKKIKIISNYYLNPDMYININKEEEKEVRYRELSFSKINLNEVVVECLDFACQAGELKKQKRGKGKIKLKLETDYDSAIDDFLLPVEEIRRILINLIDNAYYAVYEQKEEREKDYIPTISIKTELIDEAIKIIIKDNGKGISQKIKERISLDFYEPFMTNKPSEEGTGLGLYIINKLLCKIRNGIKDELKEKVEMKVISEENEYTQFILSFPISRDK